MIKDDSSVALLRFFQSGTEESNSNCSCAFAALPFGFNYEFFFKHLYHATPLVSIVVLVCHGLIVLQKVQQFVAHI